MDDQRHLHRLVGAAPGRGTFLLSELQIPRVGVVSGRGLAGVGLLVAVMITIFSFVWRFYIQDAESRGIDLNRKAWEASYIERGLSVPASGPREGFWGARLGKKIRDSRLGWHEPEVHIPGLLEIDSNGHQKYESMGKQKYHILIVGGSVAFGAYA